MILGRVRGEAERQPHDPGPIRQPKTGAATIEERIARHLRSQGRRIAIGRTIIPSGWVPAPETAAAITHGISPTPRILWIAHLLAWRCEKKVGKAL